MTTKYYSSKVSEQLDAYFLPLGYKRDDNKRLIYEDKDIIDIVFTSFKSFYGEYTMIIHSKRKIKIIEDYWEDLENTLLREYQFGLCVTLSTSRLDDKHALRTEQTIGAGTNN